MRRLFPALFIAVILAALAGQSILVIGAPKSLVPVGQYLSPEHDANPALTFAYLNHRTGNIQPVIAGQAGLRTAISRQRTLGIHANTASTWAALGPNPITFPGAIKTSTGRVLSQAYAASTGTVYVGSASGGVWKTTNGGTSYTPLTDSMPSPAIGSLAVDPTNNSIIYAGTGELPACGMNGCLYGMGAYKSTDGGSTWTQYGASTFNLEAIPAIVVDPSNSSRVYAAVADKGSLTVQNRGVAVSTNGGQTWTKPSSTISGYDVDDLVIDKAGNLYAGVQGQGIYLSTDHGTTWTAINTGLPAAANIDQVKLALGNGANTSPGSETLYTIMSDGSGAGFGNLLGVWRTTNGGSGWTQIKGSDANLGDQGWYDIYITGDPNNATNNTVYFGLVDVFKSINAAGGSPTFTNMTNVYGVTPAAIHPDQHALLFVGTTMYAGNDGGIYKSTNAASTFSAANGNLALSQFYDGAQSIQHPGTLIGGLQDNGEVLTTGSGWSESEGGDGFYTAIDSSNDQTMYEEYVYGTVSKSINGGGSWNQATNGMPAPDSSGNIDNAQFGAPLVMDPSNPQILYSAHQHLWRTSDGAANWTNISSSVTPTDYLTAVGVSKSAPGTIYMGDDLGNMWKTTTTGTAWASLNSSNCSTNPSPNCSLNIYVNTVTSIAVDPTNANIVYVTVSGFQGAQKLHVFKSINGGTTWTDISTTLPDIPFDSIAVNPVTPTTLYAGSDVGAYVSQDSGATWSTLGTGLPVTRVFRLLPNPAGTTVTAFTFGRGVFLWTDNGSPAITSAASTAFTVGTAGTFTVTSTGSPTPSLSATGTLPFPLTITYNGNGTATLAGTTSTTGTFPLTITATNSAGTASQSFTLTVGTVPAITSANSTTFSAGTSGSFTVTTSGFPTPGLTTIGSLPSGITFVDNGNGTATLAGTATVASSSTITITASNTAGTATQAFTLTVTPPPPTGTITASPNPTTTGSTMLTWSTSDSSFAQIYVSVNGGSDILVGGGTPSSTSIPWISAGNTYLFKLYAGSSHTTLLASVTVTYSAPTITGNLTVSPNPTTTGSTTLTWSTSDNSSAQIYVSVNGGSDILVGGGTPSSTIIPWISAGNTYVFKLYAGSSHTTLLASVTVTYSAPTITGTITATPNPTTTGSTSLTWSTSDSSFAQIYVSVNGGSDILIGGGTPDSLVIPWISAGNTYVFKLYAGTAHTSQLSSVSVTRSVPTLTGTISASPNPTTTGSTSLTWTTSDNSFAQIYVSVNGGSDILVGGGTPSSTTIPWITAGNTYVFKLYTGTSHTTLLASVTVTRSVPALTGTISASPNPSTTGTTTLTWTTSDNSFAQIYVSVNGGSDILIGGGTPDSLVIPWITTGNTYVFKLYAGTTHATQLASVTVTSSTPTVTGTISASPNPTTTGSTSLTWSTSDNSSAQIYVSVNGGSDVLVGGGTPSSTIIPWITNPNTYVFKLYAGSSHTTLLASVSVTHT